MLRDLFSLFPAHAGVIPGQRQQAKQNGSFPRTCGGDPNWQFSCTIDALFSPHMRG